MNVDASRLKKLIEQIAGGVVENTTPYKKVHAKLKSISPPTFELGDGTLIKEFRLITPKYRVFREDEIGKEFVLSEDSGGQQFIYEYEAAERGKNGIPYYFDFHNEFKEDTVIGYVDPTNKVHVLPGLFFNAKGKHERGRDD